MTCEQRVKTTNETLYSSRFCKKWLFLSFYFPLFSLIVRFPHLPLASPSSSSLPSFFTYLHSFISLSPGPCRPSAAGFLLQRHAPSPPLPPLTPPSFLSTTFSQRGNHCTKAWRCSRYFQSTSAPPAPPDVCYQTDDAGRFVVTRGQRRSRMCELTADSCCVTFSPSLQHSNTGMWPECCVTHFFHTDKHTSSNESWLEFVPELLFCVQAFVGGTSLCVSVCVLDHTEWLQLIKEV